MTTPAKFVEGCAMMPIKEHDQADFLRTMESAAAMAKTENPQDGHRADDSLEKQAATTGEFDIRGRVGQKFQKAYKVGSEKHAQYKLMNPQQKRDERKRWAKETFAQVIVGKSYESSYKRVDEEAGEWHTLGSLIVSLGGWQWEPAITGGKLHFAKAVRMGGDWCRRDEMSELLMVMKLNRKHSGIMQQSWNRFTQWKQEHENPDIRSSAS